MGDEARTAVRPSTAPARYEPESHMLEQGRKIGPSLYRLILPGNYVKDGSANRAFGLDRLDVGQARDFSKRVLGVVGASVESLFAYKPSREDEEGIGEVVGKEYPLPVDNPDFRVTTAQVLIATLKAAGRVLEPRVIEKAGADSVAMGLQLSDDQELRRTWASLWQGAAGGAAEQLTDGPDAVSERKRVEELKELVGKAEGEEERKQGEDIEKRIEYGLGLREETAESLRQFGGEVWR